MLYYRLKILFYYIYVCIYFKKNASYLSNAVKFKFNFVFKTQYTVQKTRIKFKLFIFAEYQIYDHF